jgi:hypothetical protein
MHHHENGLLFAKKFKSSSGKDEAMKPPFRKMKDETKR